MCHEAASDLLRWMRQFYRDAAAELPGSTLAPVIAVCGNTGFLVAAGWWHSVAARSSALRLLTESCRPCAVLLAAPSPFPSSDPLEGGEIDHLVFVTLERGGAPEVVKQSVSAADGIVVFGDEESLGPRVMNANLRVELTEMISRAQELLDDYGPATWASWVAARDLLAAEGFVCLGAPRH